MQRSMVSKAVRPRAAHLGWVSTGSYRKALPLRGAIRCALKPFLNAPPARATQVGALGPVVPLQPWRGDWHSLREGGLQHPQVPTQAGPGYLVPNPLKFYPPTGPTP